VQDTGGNESRRIDVGHAQRLAAISHQAHLLARRKSCQRRRGRIDLVTEHPQVTRAQTTVFATSQTQFRQVGID
jgi:hypothetical protein